MFNLAGKCAVVVGGTSGIGQAISRQAAHLGRGLRLITASLSPELILITGDLTTSWSRFEPIIQEELEATMLPVLRPLRITNESELSRLRGAAAVVLQRHSGYHRSTHMPGAGKRSRKRTVEKKL